MLDNREGTTVDLVLGTQYAENPKAPRRPRAGARHGPGAHGPGRMPARQPGERAPCTQDAPGQPVGHREPRAVGLPEGETDGE
ncbi:hypothetical protein [Demequina litorisediminis]|uniref:hypothetical protein n=1 Tax=Demequina litorisediminis TaxID=1849022 RepID=UPI0024E08266|nr:hypothetical protein [Demequina litorisediminis]